MSRTEEKKDQDEEMPVEWILFLDYKKENENSDKRQNHQLMMNYKW